VLARGPLSPRKAMEHAQQIARGLAAAHERGVVHRDLKPANDFVTKDGRVTILDFGLAKLTHVEAVDGGSQLSTDTAEGKAVGTAGYMSPEQVRGQGVDARSDIFAFGTVVYGMLSGRRAFPGDTAADTMTAILTKDPEELSRPGLDIPPSLARIVRRCLEKDPAERFQSAKDVAFALEAESGTSHVALASASSAPRRWWLRWAAIAALMAVAAAGGAWFSRQHRRLQRPLGREAAGDLLAEARSPGGDLARPATSEAPQRVLAGRARDPHAAPWRARGHVAGHAGSGAARGRSGAAGARRRARGRLVSGRQGPCRAPQGRRRVAA
jgi:Protein kinase domain